MPDEDRAKALTRAELATLLSAIPEDWHLFFEFLVHTGLRSGRRDIPAGAADDGKAHRASGDELLRPEGARALVGMPWVSFHTFRHTCASLLFANGKHIKQTQTWLGHADAGFTLRTYVHLLEEGVGSADFLDDAIEVGRGPWSEDPVGS